MKKGIFKSDLISLVVLVCLFAIFVVWAAPATEAHAKLKKGKLNLGLVLPLSQGQLSIVAMSWKRGMDLYYEKLNAEGGLVIGDTAYKVNVYAEDGGADPELSRVNTIKLIRRKKAKIVFGGWDGPSNSTMSEVCAQNKAAHIVLTHLVPHDIGEIGPDKPWTGRLSMSLFVSTPVLLDFMKKKYPNVKRVGMPLNEAYTDIRKLYEDCVTERGFEVITQIVSGYITDHIPIMTRLLKEKPDAIVQPLAADTFFVLKAARQLGFKGPFVSFAPMGPDLFFNMSGPEACTDLITGGFDIDQPNEIQKYIMDKWKEKYKEHFVSDATMAWDAGWVLTQIMQKAQSVDPQKVLATMETMTQPGCLETSFGPSCIGGKRTYGINRVLIRPLPITWVMNQKVVHQEYVTSPWE